MLAPESTIVRHADSRVRKMADTMRAIGPDNCTVPVLLAEGYSQHELDVYGNAARQLATDRFTRRTETLEEGFTWTDDDVVAIFEANCGALIDIGDIVAVLRRRGVPIAAIDRAWPKLAIKIAAAIAKTPASSIAELRQAVA